MSRPPARHQKPSRRSPYRPGTHDYSQHDFIPYDAGYGDARYGAWYEDARYEDAWYEDARFDDVRYGDGWYEDPRYGDARYGDARYSDARYSDARYGDARYGDAPDDLGAAGRRPPPGRRDLPARRRPSDRPGAHARHRRPSGLQRKPVRIAAALAGSTLLVSAAAPVVAHWHGLASHPTALDQDNPSGTRSAVADAGTQIPGQPATPVNTLDQWAKVPVGKHAAAEVAAFKRRAARRAAQQQSQGPQPEAASSSAYQNPLRAVSDLVLERVDMGVDFGGSGPVYALGDGIITNATADSSGWPGGGWITYQLTDGPDAGLVVYLAEDVTPTVQVGQHVTSSTVIANMFNGGDGIETGWATSDGSTAESQMAAAGGISGNGPFPTMVGLSFEAVLESVGVPAAPNASQPGNGLLPAGYPAVAS